MVFTKKLVSSSWLAVGVMLSVCMTGCTSTESIGSFWLGEDGEITHHAEPVPVPSRSGLELSLIHISEPTDRTRSRMPSSA